jgi:HEAT repeat protein
MNGNTRMKRTGTFLTSMIVPGVVAAFVVLVALPASAAPGPQASEAELLAVLRSDAPEADRAITCKFLAVNGSAAAVDDLAKLLSHPRLASWARIALEAIPGEEASAALREAAGNLDGRLLVGVLTSLGVRGDAAAVPLLAGKLTAGDAEIAGAAAWSLGQIATDEAAAALAGGIEKASSPERLDGLARAAVLCAANLQAAGRSDAALTLFDVIQSAEVSDQRRAEAIRGTVIARGIAEIPLLVETLQSPNRRLANMAVFTARDLGRGDRGDEALAAAVDAALVKQFERTASEGAIDQATILIDVLVERNTGHAREPVLAALITAAGTGEKPVRLTAIRGLGQTGDAAVTGTLLAVMTDDDGEIAEAARSAVAVLPGEAVDRVITQRLSKADADTLPVIVELIGRRRIDAITDLLPLVDHPDGKVRTATIVALGSIIDLEHLDLLIGAATTPKSDAEGEAARTALREASVRMPDREGCAAKLAAALATTPTGKKVMLLEVLAEVGGTKAVETMAEAGNSGEQLLEDAATRLLGKWMTADAAPVLLEIAIAEPGGNFKTRALRGYLRIARQFVLSNEERAAMCRKALTAASTDEDRKTVLEIVMRYPSNATLAVAEEAAKTPGLEAAGKKAANTIKGKLQSMKKSG